MPPRVCASCLRVPPAPGRSRCKSCAERDREGARRRKAEWARKKLCAHCGGKRKPGRSPAGPKAGQPYTHCERCLGMFGANAARYRRQRGLKPRPLPVGPKALPPSYARILEAVRVFGGLRGQALAEALGMERNIVYVYVGRLEKRKLLKKWKVVMADGTTWFEWRLPEGAK